MDRFVPEAPVDNEAYLNMIFTGYRKLKETRESSLGDRKSVDFQAIKEIKAAVEKGRGNTIETEIKRPVPMLSSNRISVTEKSWEECLDYYEVMMDRLGEKKPYNVPQLLAIESWFIQIIEPLPDFEDTKLREEWYAREKSKLEKYHSSYLTPQLHEIVAFVIYENLPSSFNTKEHLERINFLMENY